MLGDFPDGVWVVDFSSVDSADRVVAEVAAPFGVSAGSADLLIEQVADRHVLLILDNCEHLVDPIAGVVRLLVQSCPSVRLLCTSREPLGLAAESIVAVGPLAHADAVALFVDRTRAVAPDFHAEDADREILTEVCGRLDNLPLAIELARATVEWSFGLLGTDEQTLLGRLTVFRGTFDLSAVLGVCSLPPTEQGGLAPVVARLAQRSVLTVERSGGDVRYRLLESVRDFRQLPRRTVLGIHPRSARRPPPCHRARAVLDDPIGQRRPPLVAAHALPGERTEPDPGPGAGGSAARRRGRRPVAAGPRDDRVGDSDLHRALREGQRGPGSADEQAQTHLVAALRARQQGGVTASAMGGIGQLAVDRDPRRGLVLLDAATALRERSGVPFPVPVERPRLAASPAVVERCHDHARRLTTDCTTDLVKLWAGAAPCLGVTRARLHQILLDEAAGVACRLGVAVTSGRQDGDQVAVGFSDGTQASYGLVVGADGVGSTVRRLAVGGPAPCDAGVTGWRSVSPVRPAGPPELTLVMGDGCFFGLVPVGDGATYGFAGQPGPRRDDPPEGRLDRLRARFAGLGGSVPQFLAGLRSDDQIHSTRIRWVQAPRWHVGRVVLAGDAAHAVPPHLGEGGAMGYRAEPGLRTPVGIRAGTARRDPARTGRPDAAGSVPAVARCLLTVFS